MEKEYDNIIALTEDNDHISIADAVSGANGYFCRGCSAEMIAYKGQFKPQYFGHKPDNISASKRKCTISNELYRHDIAKEILQRIKEIKVPNLYKKPPNGIEGGLMLLNKSKIITAEYVKNEIQFYENEFGKICFGKNIDFKVEKNKELLIQPDVTFFDNDKQPILFIEIVATHDITPDKLLKLFRLGIDTIAVRPPKDSEQAIEKCFYKTSRTEWIYNHQRENTIYEPVSIKNSAGIPSINPYEETILRTVESFKCRSTEIRKTIRGLEQYLESAQYQTAKQRLEREIQRTEDNAEKAEGEVLDLQGRIDEEVDKSFRQRRDEIAKTRTSIGEKEGYFDEYTTNLESIFEGSRNRIRESQKSYQPECRGEIEEVERQLVELGAKATTFEEEIKRIRDEEERFIAEVEKRRNSIRKLTNRELEIKRNLATEEVSLPKRNEESERKIREENEVSFTARRNELRERFAEFRKQSIADAENEDYNGISRIRARTGKLFKTRRELLDIRQAKSDRERFKQLKVLVRQGIIKKEYERKKVF